MSLNHLGPKIPGQVRRPLLNPPTLGFREFVEAHYLPYIKKRKRSYATDISVLKNHILPTFGNSRLDEITKLSVVSFHTEKRSQGYAPGTVDRLVILLRYIFNLAVKWGCLSPERHPVRDFDLFNVPNGRERYLTSDETDRLFDALRKSDNKDLFNIVHGLLLTGCRRGELLGACWRDIDMQLRVWIIPLTKQGRPHKLPITKDLENYFLGLPSFGKSEFLFPNPKTGKPYCNVFYSWDRARKLAELSDLRIHDLRHSFASILVNGGRSLYEVQRLLGHSSPRTTSRYAHLSSDSMAEAMSVVKTFLDKPSKPL